MPTKGTRPGENPEAAKRREAAATHERQEKQFGEILNAVHAFFQGKATLQIGALPVRFKPD